MRYIVILGFLMFAGGKSFAQDVNTGGKTYYFYDEETKQRVKEIFHYVQIIKLVLDPYNPGEYIDTVMKVKSGPYTMYYEGGQLMKSGFYKNGVQDSTWKFYNEKGILLRTEFYRNGKLVP